MNIRVISKAGKITEQRKAIIKIAKSTIHNLFLYRADGSVERYFGTYHNKSGYSKMTYKDYPIEFSTIQFTEL